MKVRRGRANQLIEIGERLEREYAEQFLETDAEQYLFEQENGRRPCGRIYRKVSSCPCGRHARYAAKCFVKKYKNGILYGEILKKECKYGRLLVL